MAGVLASDIQDSGTDHVLGHSGAVAVGADRVVDGVDGDVTQD